MIILDNQEPCIRCGGTGKVKITGGKNKGKERTCPNCQGKGWQIAIGGLIVVGIVIFLAIKIGF